MIVQDAAARDGGTVMVTAAWRRIKDRVAAISVFTPSQAEDGGSTPLTRSATPSRSRPGAHGPEQVDIMKVLADLCIVPMGVGPSVSPYVREIKALIEASGLSATMHPNGTNIEGELSEICALAERCEARLAELGVQRTFFTLIFSTRRDKDQSMADKLAAVT